MYGMGADSLAGRLSKSTGRRVDLSEAQAHISKLFQRFPKIKDFMAAQKKLGADKGWVQTLGGRRRYLPALSSGKPSMGRAYAERQAVNTVIQGSAADMTKLVRTHSGHNINRVPRRACERCARGVRRVCVAR